MDNIIKDKNSSGRLELQNRLFILQEMSPHFIYLIYFEPSLPKNNVYNIRNLLISDYIMKTSIDNAIKRQGKEYTLFFLLLSLAIFPITTACSNSTGSEPDTEQLTEERAIETLIQVIHDAGLYFPSKNKQSSKNKGLDTKDLSDINLFATDYIDTDINDAGNLKVRLWLGPDGNIIPKPDWQAANPNICSKNGQYMEPARTLLEFTIFADSKSVQFNYIDIATGKIEKSVMAEPELPDPNWLVNAMSEAWNKMQQQSDIKDATTPCGDIMDLQVHLKTKITTTITTETEEDEVNIDVHVDSLQANFELSFDEDDNYYDGYGPIERHYSYPGPTGNGSCTTPNRAIDVEELTKPWSQDGSPEAVIRLFGDGSLTKECGIAQEQQYVFPLAWQKLNNVQWYYGSFTISNWEMMSTTSEILMQKVLDRTVTEDTGIGLVQITEKGIIEIRKK
ncbi:hypothetical protein Asal01_02472 [Fodinibius salicampi]